MPTAPISTAPISTAPISAPHTHSAPAPAPAPARAPAPAPAPAAPFLLAVVLPTPAGPLAVVATPEDGVVRASGFESVERTAHRLPLELRDRAVRELTGEQPAAEPAIAGVVDAVRRYAAGDAAALGSVPVEQHGGPFFQAVWAAMRAIPAGQTASYAELAAVAGRPAAVRAAGSACARNLVAPFVPCHRVLRTGGDLGGYYYGTATKRTLLVHEGALTVAAGGSLPELDLGLEPLPAPAVPSHAR
ncbi:methylated-DNA--[protein]-cysteine S-methyltransferase [Pengzhenrongella sicca]|uniref:Methylated-DNA--[protein]-cysteine S-methyltransferase n=1 Tax=Pengzhenrongella sicca TaxID=2819238 RepID=A0A8A4ZCQ3_9MICO|nr:methylated-DNA--[protein]-cysteine S-methyltransferase [Pengzhenrongella sicca]QTE29674.1 methylated-DNA--[protein]-cysteine S-methyltransferase [Pengzhenrongella sicca]